MAQFSTDYTPAGITTTTSAPPPGAGSGLDPHLQGIADQIMQMKLDAYRRRTWDEAAARQQAEKDKRRGDTDPIYHQPPGVIGDRGGGPGTVQQQMQQIALQDAEQQVAAKSRRAPTRTVSGPNIISGETVDPLAMNAYQREAFLPQASTQRGGF